MPEKHSVRRLALVVLCSSLSGILSASEAGAYNLVNVNGKTYAQVRGKLHPATYHETRLHGKVHRSWWSVDWDYVAPEVSIPTPHIGTPATTGGSRAARATNKRFSVRDVGTKHYITISADVLFEFDKWDLTDKAAAVLAEVGPVIAKYGVHTTVISGHTDAVGTDQYNQELSEKRARTVKEWLTGHGFISGSVTTHGAGERSPVAANTYSDGTDYPEGRAKNRRVEIVVDTAR